jgi:hypothetical protein
VAGDDRRECRGLDRLAVAARDRLDAREDDVAAVSEAKAARIGDLGDAAFALRSEGAVGRDHGIDRCHQQQATKRDRGAARACKFNRFRQRLHTLMFA